MLRYAKICLIALLVSGCAGFQRNCSSFNATTFGSDWIVTQNRVDGTPYLCWILRGTSISNEDKSDGIYWLDPQHGHLVHLAGWYDRVQVSSGNFQSAATLIGVDAAKCNDGKYPSN